MQEILQEICKNFSHQVKSIRPKIMDSEAILQAREANPTSSTWRVSGELNISQSIVSSATESCL